MNQYAIYLRKSRADVENEQKADTDILKRHEKTLLEYARRQNLSIIDIYREVVSGDSIAARPKMQELLAAVEQGSYAGVLVMDVDRLARGDTMDQGFVAQAFKFSNTKIVTPMKTYDPNNEFDEEYFEFGLFMSRREYKIINRRLQRGRVASVKEGKYVSNKAPYGYKRVPLEKEKGFTLEVIPEQAEIVRMIFDFYTVGEKQKDGTYKRLGASLITRRLNTLKIPSSSGGWWYQPTIRDMLINPVYIGKIRWNWRPEVKKMVDGQVVKERPRASAEDCIVADGLHEGIVSIDTFNLAQELIAQNPPRPVGERSTVKNPLSGIVVCGKCGRKMTRRPYANGYPDTLICQLTGCENVSSHLYLVEERILEALAEWLEEYKLQWELGMTPQMKNSHASVKKKMLQKAINEISLLEKQRSNAHDLLEQEVYDTETFLTRTRELGERIKQAEEDRLALEENLQIEEAHEVSRHVIIPKVEYLLDVYKDLPTPKEKNDLLKEVLEKVVYVKNVGGRWHNNPDEFEITLYPKLPK